jgi:hypothetical protein
MLHARIEPVIFIATPYYLDGEPMKTSLLLATAIAVVLAASPVWADDKDKKDADVEKALSRIAKLGPGVHAIKKDKQGRVMSCIIVGQARISTVLGKAKGLQDARDKARTKRSSSSREARIMTMRL